MSDGSKARAVPGLLKQINEREVLDEDFFEPPQALTPSVSASSSVSVSALLIPCLLLGSG